jgi:hypothetical protein
MRAGWRSRARRPAAESARGAVRRGTLIAIILLFALIAAAAVWQLVLFLRIEPIGPPGPTPTLSP